MVADRPVTSAEIFRGETEPIAGWASRGYGGKERCSTLRATLIGPAPAAAMTFIMMQAPNSPRDPVVRRLTVESGKGIACAYEHHGFEDIAVLSTGDSEMTVADFRMRGEFFWMRLAGGEIKQVLAIQAISLDRGGLNIFRRSEPGPYVEQSGTAVNLSACQHNLVP
jgi:hypothetical protein